MNEPFEIKRINPWRTAICILATLPTIFVFVTWDVDGQLSPAGYALRILSLPIMLGELGIIIIAMRMRFSFLFALNHLGVKTKILLGIWLVFAVLPIFLSGPNFSLQLLTTMQWALHGLFFASAVHLARNAENADRNWALSVLAFGALAYIAVLILFVLTIPEKLTFPWVYRLPTGTNVRQIGYFAAIASVAPASLVLFSKLRVPVFVFVFIMLVGFIAWTGSRGALIGLFVGTVVALPLTGRLPSKVRGFLMLSSWLVGLAISLMVPNPTPEFGLVRMASSLAQEDVGSGRQFVWESTLTEISKSPWVGHGSGSFNENMRNIYEFDFNHPHQFLLQFVYDWGVMGGLSAALLILSLFLHCLRRARQRKDAAAYASIAALCVISAVGMIDGALFYPFSIFLALSIVVCSFDNRAIGSDDRHQLFGRSMN